MSLRCPIWTRPFIVSRVKQPLFAPSFLAFPHASFHHQRSSIRGSVNRSRLASSSYQSSSYRHLLRGSHVCLSGRGSSQPVRPASIFSWLLRAQERFSSITQPFPTNSTISLLPSHSTGPICAQALTSCGERQSRIVYAVARCGSASILRQFVLVPIWRLPPEEVQNRVMGLLDVSSHSSRTRRTF